MILDKWQYSIRMQHKGNTIIREILHLPNDCVDEVWFSHCTENFFGAVTKPYFGIHGILRPCYFILFSFDLIHSSVRENNDDDSQIGTLKRSYNGKFCSF